MFENYNFTFTLPPTTYISTTISATNKPIIYEYTGTPHHQPNEEIDVPRPYTTQPHKSPSNTPTNRASSRNSSRTLLPLFSRAAIAAEKELAAHEKKNPSSRSSRIPGNNGGGRGGRPPHAFFRTQRGALSPFLRAQAPPRLFFVARKPRGRRFVLVGSFFARVSLPRIGFAIVSTLLDCQRIIRGMVG